MCVCIPIYRAFVGVWEHAGCAFVSRYNAPCVTIELTGRGYGPQLSEEQIIVKKLKRRNALLPAWKMPSDPIMAVFWFTHWSLKVLVRYFWILIIAGVAIEAIMNSVLAGILSGLASGGVTLLIGLVVWGGLALLLFIFNSFMGVARTVSQINDLRQGFTTGSMFDRSAEDEVDSSKVVEGTITDLDKERKKRRQES